MTPRERLTAALRREPVDRLPWTIDLDYYNAAARDRGEFSADHAGVGGYLRQHEELGADPYVCYDAFWAFDTVFDGVEVDTRRAGDEEVTTHTLGGRSLTARQRYLRESHCWAPVEHPVKSLDDLKLLRDMLRHTRLAPRLERHAALQEQWGERGLLALGAPRTPVPALMTEWCGVETTVFLAVDAPALFADVLAALDHLSDPVYDAMAQYRPVVVHFPDNISGENVASFWDRYMAPIYRRRLEQFHAEGIVCAIHNDGSVRAALGRIAATGFDAAEAITPAPVGDVDLAHLRELAGREDFVIWGLVPGAMFTADWSDDQFRAHVRRALEECTGPIILGTADQIPPDGIVGRVALVAEMLAEM